MSPLSQVQKLTSSISRRRELSSPSAHRIVNRPSKPPGPSPKIAARKESRRSVTWQPPWQEHPEQTAS